jgi:hypothetical protein
MKGRISIVAALPVALTIAACGGEEISYSDREIIDRLNLEETADGDAYAIDGDPFCEIEKKLLNDAEEVEDAAEGRNGNLVIASREANVGVKGREGIVPDCQETARKKLNRLDPPQEE